MTSLQATIYNAYANNTWPQFDLKLLYEPLFNLLTAATHVYNISNLVYWDFF
jgi:hypothetical protein